MEGDPSLADAHSEEGATAQGANAKFRREVGATPEGKRTSTFLRYG
jgi:hypothetical protein